LRDRGRLTAPRAFCMVSRCMSCFPIVLEILTKGRGDQKQPPGRDMLRAP